MLPPPYPVLIYLMVISFGMGMVTYRALHILVRRYVDRKHSISHGQIK